MYSSRSQEEWWGWVFGESSVSCMTVDSGEATTVSSGTRVIFLRWRWRSSFAGRNTHRISGLNATSFLRVFPHIYIPNFRTPCLHNQSTHFKSRPTVWLGGQFALWFSNSQAQMLGLFFSNLSSETAVDKVLSGRRRSPQVTYVELKLGIQIPEHIVSFCTLSSAVIWKCVPKPMYWNSNV